VVGGGDDGGLDGLDVDVAAVGGDVVAAAAGTVMVRSARAPSSEGMRERDTGAGGGRYL
jgi:hypothetical protein